MKKAFSFFVLIVFGCLCIMGQTVRLSANSSGKQFDGIAHRSALFL